MAKRSTIEIIQKTLAAMGIVTVVLTCEPKIVKGIDRTARLVKTAPYIDLDVIEDKQFLNEFKKCLEKNEFFTEEEKKDIYEGFEKFFYDWGYLLDTTGRRNILFQIEHVKVQKGKNKLWNAPGNYNFGIIKTLPRDDKQTVYHENAHNISEHGLLVGTMGGYGAGYYLNEGVNSSVNIKYYYGEDGYEYARYITTVLSLIVGSEPIMDAYINGNLDKLVDNIVINCPGLTTQYIYKFLFLWDEYSRLFRYVNAHKDELSDEEYQKMKEKSVQYSNRMEEMLKEIINIKFNVDLSSTLIGNCKIQKANFLDDTFSIEIEENNSNIPYVISGIRRDYAFFDISKIDIDKYKTINDSEYLDLLYNIAISNDQKSIISSYNAINDEKLLVELASYYSNQDMVLDVIDTIYNNILDNTNSFDQQFMYKYAKIVIEKGLNKSSDPMFLAAFYKEQVKIINEILGSDFSKAFFEMLKVTNREDIIHYYLYSDIMFDQYNEEDGFQYSFRSPLTELVEINSFSIDKENNKLIVEKEIDDFEIWYGDMKIKVRIGFLQKNYEENGKRYYIYDLNYLIDNGILDGDLDYSKFKIYENKYTYLYEKSLEEEQSNGYAR